jgi:hypothetical protein
MLPALQGDDALLPVGIHRASIADIRKQFGSKAVPKWGSRRDMIIDALDIYVRMVRSEFLKPTIWVNGGLVTGKLWQAPDDADVAVLVDPSQVGADLNERVKLLQTGHADHLSVGPHTLTDVHIKPMGGLIDGYIMADTPAARRYWGNWFSSVRLPDERISSTLAKGFVEVT